MRFDHHSHAFRAIGLGLALTIVWPCTSHGQGLPPSSGSGSGTGTGMSSGFPGSTGTGRESGSGLGTTGTGAEGMMSPREPRALQGMGLTRPIDRSGLPNRGTPGAGGLSRVTDDLFTDARAVNDPGERALALVRIAQTAIFSRQLEDAHIALFEAGPAALVDRDPLIREQRLTAIINALLDLAEARMSETTDVDLGAPIDDPLAPKPAAAATPPAVTTPPAAAPPAAAVPAISPSLEKPPAPAPTDPITPPQVAALPGPPRISRLRAALPEWAKAVELAIKIDKATPRTESLFRIVESEAYNSQRLVTDPLRAGGGTGGRPDPSALEPEIRAFVDNLLISASQHAQMIERPIWRDYAAFSIISNAATSSQFTRGFQIARAIQQPEARTNALIRLAEGQALNARPNEATAAYEEAARSVTLIPQEDPRETLVGVLIDSLISFGRFDDARACVPLYSFKSRQLTALLAVAESQGRRNLAGSAREWISKEDPAFQAQLYRKVNDGILAAIEQNRSKDLSDRGR
jgi:hypothetical protein